MKILNNNGSKDADLFYLLWGDVVSLLLVFFVILFSYSNINMAESNFEGKVRALSQSMQETPQNQQKIDLTPEEKKLLKDYKLFKTLIGRLNLSISYFTSLASEETKADPKEFKAKIAELKANVAQLDKKHDLDKKKDLLFAVEEPQLVSYIEDAYKTDKLYTELEQKLSKMDIPNNYSLYKDGDQIKFDILDHAFFGYQSFKLTNKSKRMLSSLAESLKDIPGFIEVEGHTDNIPMKANHNIPSNWEFSAYRAAIVIRHLEALGIPSHRFKLVGYAHHKPLAENSTLEGRRKNRRISLTVVREQ